MVNISDIITGAHRENRIANQAEKKWVLLGCVKKLTLLLFESEELFPRRASEHPWAPACREQVFLKDNPCCLSPAFVRDEFTD